MGHFKLVSVLIAAFVSTGGFAQGHFDVTRGVKVREVDVSARNTQCETGQRFGCADCFTAQICQWNGVPIESSRYRCDSVDRSKPYCSGNTGVCTSEPSTACIKPSDLCPEAGFFPQPSNCSEFIYCDADKNAVILTCDRNQAYSHKVQDCVQIRTAQDCFRINCAAAASQNQWFTYTPAPQLYVYCSSTVGPMTFQCQGDNIAFDQRTRQCVFRCPAVGRYPIPGEPAGSPRYYQCSQAAGNVIQYSVQQCPSPLIFDSERQRCSPPSATVPGNGNQDQGSQGQENQEP